MRKWIQVVSVLFITAVCLSGCGSQKRVSNKNFREALETYQEYYRDLCNEADECYIQLALDAEGLPYIVTASVNEKFNGITVKMEISTTKKGKIYTLLSEKVNEDKFLECVLYSDGIIAINGEDDMEWFQVTDGELEEVAYCERYSKRYTFHMGKEDIEIDLSADDQAECKEEYAKICKKLYGNQGSGAEFGKRTWFDQLYDDDYVDRVVFLQSPVIGWTEGMMDSSDFRRMVSRLEQDGSMTNEEFVVWNYNYIQDTGDEAIFSDAPSACSLIYKNPLLFNEIDGFMPGDREMCQFFLLSYLNTTQDWKTAEKIELLKEIDEEQLENWQLLGMFSCLESTLTSKPQIYESFTRDGLYYLKTDYSFDTQLPYQYFEADDAEEEFQRFYEQWDEEVEDGDRAVEDILLLKHIETKFGEEYTAQAGEKEGMEYLRASMELTSDLPKLLETWEEEYIGSEQMERDYEEYIKDKYVAFIEDGNDYVSQCGYEYADVGYVFVKIGDEDVPSLLRFFQFPEDPYYPRAREKYDYNIIDILTYFDGQITEYSLRGKVYWIDESKSIYIDEYWRLNIYSYILWTLKDGVGYIAEGKEKDGYSYAEERYYLMEGESADAFGYGDNVSYTLVSEQEYNEAMPEYVYMTKFPRLTGPKHLYCDDEPGQIFGKTYAVIEEAFEAYLQNPDGGIEVIEVASNGSLQGNTEVQNSGNENSEQTNESSSAAAEDESAVVPAEKPVLDIVVEDEVTQIRAWYNETQNNSDSYEFFSALDGNITCYKGSELIRLDVAKGFDDWNYTRRYYFRNDSLYFAFVFNGSEEHRFYFKEDQLIRYIDDNKNAYDYGDTDRFAEWSAPVLNEAYQLYDEYAAS